MDSMEEPRRELSQKLHPLISPCSYFDTLSYLREGIKGMSAPQFYLKDDGSWTGGHEENNRIRSFNINHGNNSNQSNSEWYGVALNHSDKLYSEIEKLKNSPYVDSEGTWYQNHDYLLKNKIPIYYCNQKAGDIIIVGIGLLHWVRSKGYSVHTSWNICPKEVNQFRSSMEKYNLYQTLKLRSLVPKYTLMIDLLNFELYNLDLNLVEYCYNILEKEINLRKEEFSQCINMKKYKSLPVDNAPDNCNVVICEYCLNEIVYCWAMCLQCKEFFEKGYEINMCISYFKSHKCLGKSKPYLFFKYYDHDMDK